MPKNHSKFSCEQILATIFDYSYLFDSATCFNSNFPKKLYEISKAKFQKKFQDWQKKICLLKTNASIQPCVENAAFRTHAKNHNL
jgi:hypothetical protein